MLRLRDIVLARFGDLNPGVDIPDEHPIIIAGEWVGPSIQRGSTLGLQKLATRYFVIISIIVNQKWVSDQAYAAVENVEAGIYNVSRSAFYDEVLDFEDRNPCSKRMMDLTLAVEKENSVFPASEKVSSGKPHIHWEGMLDSG